ncbi:MAG: calcium-binding protein [Burkholderiales bacterium]|jgi:Ca2+-binding RTX toxin-like protein|nr:calcium-binding protein [Burkholderiales bacterium]
MASSTLSSISNATPLGRRLDGTSGDDLLIGDLGHDTLFGGVGNDTLRGDAGDDVYYVDSAGDVIVELASDNTSTQQSFSLGCFSDVVIASVSYTLADNVAVEDLMALGTLTESSLNPTGINLTGNNLGQGLIGNSTANQLYGMGGDDILFGAGGSDSLFGGEGDDGLIGGLGNDSLSGDAGDDIFAFNLGTSTGNLMSGAQTTVSLTGGNDTADGGNGDDTIFMRGALQNYNITRLNATEYQISVKAGISGISSSETMTFRNIEKLAFGELDNIDNDIRQNAVLLSSVVTSSIYDDILSASSNANWSSNGLAGNDMLEGRAGNDTLNGGAGADTLDGGASADVLTGGLGRDQFKFSSSLGDGNIDTVTDFTRGTDKILLDDAVFTQLSSVQSLVGRLVVGGSGAKAMDGNDYFIFNSVSRVLSYDPDGNGAMAMQAFATMTGVTTLAASDFQII